MNEQSFAQFVPHVITAIPICSTLNFCSLSRFRLHILSKTIPVKAVKPLLSRISVPRYRWHGQETSYSGFTSLQECINCVWIMTTWTRRPPRCDGCYQPNHPHRTECVCVCVCDAGHTYSHTYVEQCNRGRIQVDREMSGAGTSFACRDPVYLLTLFMFIGNLKNLF